MRLPALFMVRLEPGSMVRFPAIWRADRGAAVAEVDRRVALNG